MVPGTGIAIIDYGMGNLTSVLKAFAFLGAKARITFSPKEVMRAKALVFPGVGAFGEAMAELKKRGLIDPIQGAIREGKPFLGLCLGLQLLFSSSEESPGIKGLGILPGSVRRLPSQRNLKVPHMGWNQIQKVSTDRRSTSDGRGNLLEGVPEGAFMYFVHSYYAQPLEKRMILATTKYGCLFPSILTDGRHLWATQFHPEKSQKWGLKILENFLKSLSEPVF